MKIRWQTLAITTLFLNACSQGYSVGDSPAFQETAGTDNGEGNTTEGTSNGDSSSTTSSQSSLSSVASSSSSSETSCNSSQRVAGLTALANQIHAQPSSLLTTAAAYYPGQAYHLSSANPVLVGFKARVVADPVVAAVASSSSSSSSSSSGGTVDPLTSTGHTSDGMPYKPGSDGGVGYSGGYGGYVPNFCTGAGGCGGALGLAVDATFTSAAHVDFHEDFFLLQFWDNGLIHANSTTYLCRTSTDCSPSSSDFIVGLKFGDVDPTKYDASSLATSDVIHVKRLILPGHNYDLWCGGQGSSGSSSSQGSSESIGYISPLVVEDQSGRGIATLNQESTDTYFDLVGDGLKDRISCVKDGAFIALPNAQGNIVNINQLFGNNTVGPDGQLAANGFEALKKYDRNEDGRIDAADSVYGSLRLWHDRDCNGLASADEIENLRDRGIVQIDLNYVNFFQQDQWGNQTRQRSLLMDKDGSLFKIFDLWFWVGD